MDPITLDEYNELTKELKKTLNPKQLKMFRKIVSAPIKMSDSDYDKELIKGIR